MKITPNADPSSGNFEVQQLCIYFCNKFFTESFSNSVNHFANLLYMQVVVLQDFKWYDFVLKLNKLYNGTHLSVKNVSSRRYYSLSEFKHMLVCLFLYYHNFVFLVAIFYSFDIKVKEL